LEICGADSTMDSTFDAAQLATFVDNEVDNFVIADA
jgi:hypothetical protein